MQNRFVPDEVLFFLTSACNLSCSHCTYAPKEKVLSLAKAKKFLAQCQAMGIDRVGFTGGEPFLQPRLINALATQAVKHDMVFDRIMTNGVWHRNKKHLVEVLSKLHSIGYDGVLCVSVDAFHQGQSIQKLASFIRTATKIWQQSDVVAIAYTWGAKQDITEQKIRSLAKALKAKVISFPKKDARIVNDSLCIELIRVDLSAIGTAQKLKNPWDGTWFKEDYCRGPGNVFFVLPDGTVRPCCGYASDLSQFVIGKIQKDTPQDLIHSVQNNKFVRAVFDKGLASIRKCLQKKGYKFPGKTSNHCFFCWYMLTHVPPELLDECLK